MKRTKSHAEGHENLERWLLTYADMITLLTAFFLMLYSMSVMSKGKFTQLATSVRNGFGGVVQGGTSILNGGGALSNQSGTRPDNLYKDYKQAMRNLRQHVEQHNLRGKVSAREDERGVIISLLSDKMLFTRGSSELNPQSEPVLAQVAKILKTVPNNFQIEGHTCDLPIHTAAFPSNWELSSARAGTILRYFTERQGLANNRFVAAGYAETRPLVPNSSETNRARNRRVDIVIMKTDRQKEADIARKAEIRRVSAETPPEPTPTPPAKVETLEGVRVIRDTPETGSAASGAKPAAQPTQDSASAPQSGERALEP